MRHHIPARRAERYPVWPSCRLARCNAEAVLEPSSADLPKPAASSPTRMECAGYPKVIAGTPKWEWSEASGGCIDLLQPSSSRRFAVTDMGRRFTNELQRGREHDDERCSLSLRGNT